MYPMRISMMSNFPSSQYLFIKYVGAEWRNVVGDDGICMQVCNVRRAHCGKNCLRSIEIGSGPPREASMSDATRLSERMERGFY